jgi:mannose-6-phosphate isomerase-like protein (cupin superfamily)
VKHLGTTALLLYSLVGLRSQTPTVSSEARHVEAIVKAVTHDWPGAIMRKDGQALDRLLADDFTFVSPRGRLIKKLDFIAYRTSDAFAGESARFDQVAVRMHGSAAVVTSRYISTLKAKDPVTGLVDQVNDEYMRTDTCVWADGHWRVVATQLSPIGYSGAHAETKSPQLQGRNGDDLGWAASSVFPGARFAVLHGAPYRAPYAIRMKRPDGHAEQPHYHESEEYVSVISGTVHVGVGDRLNRTSATAFRAGSFVVVPARAVHYSLAKGI